MRLCIALTAILLFGCATPQPPADEGEAALRRHIAYLASDRLQGRRPGTAGGIATEAYVAREFAAAGLRPTAGAGGWFQPVGHTSERGDKGSPVISRNVVGRLAGTGASGEALLFMAHWDHLGLCAPRGARDRICNGAVDNASGVASLIEIARSLAAGPPLDRDVLFVATTAEEIGLVGARAFADQPPIPLARVVAAFNLDTVAVAPKGAPVSIVGRGLTALDPAVEEAARSLGRSIDRSDRANALVRRQDGWALLQRGVPALLVGGAYGQPLERFLSGRYHKPDDDLASGIELGGAAEDVQLHVALARTLADRKRYPSIPRAAPPPQPLDSRATTN